MTRRTTSMGFAAMLRPDIGDPRDACNARGSGHQELTPMPTADRSLPASACSTPAPAVEEAELRVAAAIQMLLYGITGKLPLTEAADRTIGLLKAAEVYLL